MSKNILIVDTDQYTICLLTKELEAEGYVVCAVISGLEATDAVATGWPELVIMDLNVSDSPCTEVLEKIRQLADSLPIIVCTALAGLQEDCTLWPYRVKAFLPKPIHIRRLKKEICEALTNALEPVPKVPSARCLP